MTDVIERPTDGVSTQVMGYGVADSADTDDILLGYVHVCQSTSNKFLDEGAEVGDLVLTTTSEVIGTNENPLEVMLLLFKKSFRLTATEDGPRGSQGAGIGREPYTATTRQLPYEDETDDGQKFRRDIEYRFWAVRANDLDELPVVIGLKRTNLNTAKEMVTKCAAIARIKKQPSWAKTFVLTSEEVRDKGRKWQRLVAKVGRDTTEDERQVAMSWYNDLVATEKYKAAEADEGYGF